MQEPAPDAPVAAPAAGVEAEEGEIEAGAGAGLDAGLGASDARGDATDAVPISTAKERKKKKRAQLALEKEANGATGNQDGQDRGAPGDGLNPEAGAARPSKKKKAASEIQPRAGRSREVIEHYQSRHPHARPTVSLRPHPTRLRATDISRLVLWLFGDFGDPPAFAAVTHPGLIPRVLLVLVSGLDAATLAERPELFPQTRALLGPLAAAVGGANPMGMATALADALMTVPDSGKGGNGRREGRGRALLSPTELVSRATAALGGQSPPAHGLEHYRVSATHMAELGYPLPVASSPATDDSAAPRFTCPPGHVATQPPAAGAPPVPWWRRLIAIDCEMVATTTGPELARASAVDARGTVVYDALVRPASPVTDHLTRWSGIEPGSLDGITTTRADVQSALLSLVTSETYLVGHSLECDLQQLRVIHSRAMDTALLYPHPRGPPFRPALRTLAETHLGRSIQAGAGGHDSVEDARATMELALLKLVRGPAYGSPRPLGRSLLGVLGGGAGGRGLRCAVVDRPASCARLVEGTASAVTAGSDAESVSRAATCLRGGGDHAPQFVWTHLTGLSTHWEGRAQRERAAAAAAAAAAQAAAAAAAGPPGPFCWRCVSPGHSPDACSKLGGGKFSGAAHPLAGSATGAGDDDPLPEETAAAPTRVQRTPGAGITGTTGLLFDITTGAGAITGTDPAATVAVLPGPPDGPQEAMHLARAAAAVDNAVAALHASLPSGALMLLATGQGDSARVRRLQEDQWRRKAGAPPAGSPPGAAPEPWTSADEAALDEARRRAKEGLLMLAIKD